MERYRQARNRLQRPPVHNQPKPTTAYTEAEQSSCETEAVPSTSFAPDPQQLLAEMHHVTRQRDAAFVEIYRMQQNIPVMSASSVEGDDLKCQDITGLKWGTFICLFSFVSTFVITSSVSLPARDQLFVTLVKLRHNPSFTLLAHTARVSKSTVISMFWKWIDALYTNIGFLVRWPDREGIFKTIPSVFKSKFPRLTSIIDCFEIFTDAPKNLHARAQVLEQL